jgi:MFS family permease
VRRASFIACAPTGGRQMTRSSSTQAQASRDWNEIRTGWRVLFAATLGVMLGFPTLAVQTLGVFAPFLASTFKWSFSEIMGGLVIVTIVVIVIGPITGYLSDRYGARPLVFTSSVLLGFSFIGFAFSTGSLVQYYVTWLVMSVGAAGATQLVWTRPLNEHFVVHRGLALGIALSGVGFFTICGKLLAGSLIAAVGWRAAFGGIGLLPIVIAAPVSLWALQSMSEGCSSAANVSRKLALSGMTLSQALRHRRFWFLGAAFLPMSFALGGPIPNLENILLSHGFSHPTVLSLTPWLGVALIIGRTGGGWLADRIWVPLLACAFMSLNAIASLTLAQPHLTYKMALMSILLLGTATGAEIDLASYLVARYLGIRHYGVLYGILYSMVAIGGGVGPSLFAGMFDRTGTYSLVLIASAISLLCPAVVLLLLGPYPEFAKEDV